MDSRSFDGRSIRDGYSTKRSTSRSRSRGFSRSSSEDGSYKGSRYGATSRHTSRDVVRCRTPPPLVKRIVERVPTPEPQIVERVVVRPAPQTIVERVIERPRTPPPRIVHREVTESPQPTIVRTRVIKVDSRADAGVRRMPTGRYSRYEQHFDGRQDDYGKGRGRSYHCYRENRYPSRSTSRSSSRHSFRSQSRMSRSNSFDIIHVPGASSQPMTSGYGIRSGRMMGQTPTNVIAPSHQTSQYTGPYNFGQHSSSGHYQAGPSPIAYPGQQIQNMHTLDTYPQASSHHQQQQHGQQMPGPYSFEQHFIAPGHPQQVHHHQTIWENKTGGIYPQIPMTQHQAMPAIQPMVINLPSIHLTPEQMQYIGYQNPLAPTMNNMMPHAF